MTIIDQDEDKNAAKFFSLTAFLSSYKSEVCAVEKHDRLPVFHRV